MDMYASENELFLRFKGDCEKHFLRINNSIAVNMTSKLYMRRADFSLSWSVPEEN